MTMLKLVNLRQSAGILLIALAVLAGGCGGNKSGAIPVKGKLLVNGKPFGPAAIALQPANPGDKLPHASGNVAEDGTFTLKSGKGIEGALPGRYKVNVSEDVMTGKAVPHMESVTVDITKPASGKTLNLEIKMKSRKIKRKRDRLKAGPGTSDEDGGKTKKPKGPGGI